MTRVIAGMYKGRQIHTPKGSATRPTSDRAREALFSALAARGLIEGATVLDLYAGSGALGIEAVSRGAGVATLVDSDRGAVAAMRRSVSDLGLEHVSIRLRDVSAYLQGAASKHDLVFLDPPYDLPEAALADVLDALTAGWLAADAVVVVERSARSPEPTWPHTLERIQDKRYGETAVWLAEALPPS
ncbi:16S rRNA (guanine(966)-N(2))-methyltransferase RsmD [Nostocoides sp. F2B08]|uniref:16S rRNA (guanine(966)-N(2))-methyltransferase RsmD n=1 Tax=Nostocoides sp. F2B08 TaxID=2653936 RepID=UPI001262CC56|nr:16S rRNA (guanine(966)-N(2))-methyltransferase RsmD [Tetrasphaera sp. F2B08]KAB7746072.1 16S rRNA (guanine(966)-N(2))-methyltransferase RsmD [Tetrasphaera sp. F2B08]